jgi:hypothetical protein
MSKRICPCCGHNEFFADANVLQIWKVDEDGVCLGVVDNFVDVSVGPEEDKNWLCAECNTPAVEEMGREELLDMMGSLVKHLEEKCNIGDRWGAVYDVKKTMEKVLKFSGRKV